MLDFNTNILIVEKLMLPNANVVYNVMISDIDQMTYSPLIFNCQSLSLTLDYNSIFIIAFV